MNVIIHHYPGTPIFFTEEGYINITYIAKQYNKRHDHYFENLETHTYINMMCDKYDVDRSYFIKTYRGKGGGTWMHYELINHFGHWLIKRKETVANYNGTIPYIQHLRQQQSPPFTPIAINNNVEVPSRYGRPLMASLKSLSMILNSIDDNHTVVNNHIGANYGY